MVSLDRELDNVVLTAQFVSSSCEQVVENMEGPLIFGLSYGTWLLQQV